MVISCLRPFWILNQPIIFLVDLRSRLDVRCHPQVVISSFLSFSLLDQLLAKAGHHTCVNCLPVLAVAPVSTLADITCSVQTAFPHHGHGNDWGFFSKVSFYPLVRVFCRVVEFFLFWVVGCPAARSGWGRSSSQRQCPAARFFTWNLNFLFHQQSSSSRCIFPLKLPTIVWLNWGN